MILSFISSSMTSLNSITTDEGRVRFIFSDFSMPEMNGIELREKSYSKSLDIPFALVTGFYSKEMAVKGMELRICSFIEKPFAHESIEALINDKANKRRDVLNEEKEMIISFVEESYPMLEEIEDLILSLEEDPKNISVLNTYFRLLHTIKGTSACVGLKSLPDFTHKYEDLVGQLKDGVFPVNKTVMMFYLQVLIN